MDSKPTATNPATGDKSARGQSPLNLAGLRQAGELAALAYEPFLHTAMALARVPRFEVVTVGHLDLRAVIIFRPERTDILVRGTVDMENWIIDLDVRKERLADFPGVKVHAGFLKAELALLPLILEEMPMHIRRSMRPPINLYGHSLGGAQLPSAPARPALAADLALFLAFSLSCFFLHSRSRCERGCRAAPYIPRDGITTALRGMPGPTPSPLPPPVAGAGCLPIAAPPLADPLPFPQPHTRPLTPSQPQHRAAPLCRFNSPKALVEGAAELCRGQRPQGAGASSAPASSAAAATAYSINDVGLLLRICDLLLRPHTLAAADGTGAWPHTARLHPSPWRLVQSNPIQSNPLRPVQSYSLAPRGSAPPLSGRCSGGDPAPALATLALSSATIGGPCPPPPRSLPLSTPPPCLPAPDPCHPPPMPACRARPPMPPCYPPTPTPRPLMPSCRPRPAPLLPGRLAGVPAGHAAQH